MERGHLDTETLTQGECQVKIKASNGVVLLQAKNEKTASKLPEARRVLYHCFFPSHSSEGSNHTNFLSQTSSLLTFRQ